MVTNQAHEDEQQQQPVATKQTPAQADEPAPAAPPPERWDLTRVELGGYGVEGEKSERETLEVQRNADFWVDLRNAWLDEAQFQALLQEETREDKARALSVRVVEQLERESRKLRVRVVPNQPSDGVYWVRYRPETAGSRILQVVLEVDGRELPRSLPPVRLECTLV